MDYVRFGSTGLTVSRLCLGCMTYGDPGWREWVLDEEASRPFIREALESGINFFDTADMYSLGRSEEVVGRALNDMARRDEVVIATKVYNPMGPKPNQKGLSRKHILEAIDASLKRLGTDYVDLSSSTASTRTRPWRRPLRRSMTSCALARPSTLARPRCGLGSS